MPIEPQPCGSGAGGDSVDVEQIVLCDLDAEGNLLGTALAVYEYDSDGNPTGPPTFVDPATGNPYVPQGTLQPCPDAACLPPMQFCQTSTSTGPVEHPGRQYDLTLPINPGFAVQSLQVDAVNNPAGITWEVDDPDGEAFRQNLTTFIEGRVPASATVTITNPNAGVPQVCGPAQPMTVHIECVRLDQSPPNLIELVYNGGQDLIQNPAYNEFPALNPPVSQGNYGFHLLSREDDPGPFPGFPPSGDALCTSVANRGWETNDSGRTFEIWGQDVANGQNTTPTPRGTPVQEITSDGPPPGKRSTIWQTFTAPASGNFIIRVVHGARDSGEQHRITLDNGDTNDAQNGDLIDDISNPPSVTSSGGPNPWTQFSQTIPLNGGSTYTLALSTNNPNGGARGGLFTDMRAYIDRPDLRATAATDDETCVVTVDETTTNIICSYWQPQCAGGAVVGWQKVDTGETMTNAEFWAQVPAPACCLPDSGGQGGASSTLSNMLASDVVCATVGGIAQNAIRVVVTDPSGGTLQEQFLGANGAPIAPDSWTAGPCTGSRFMADQVLCDDNGPFLRKYVQSLDATNQAQVNSFRDFTLAGAPYVAVGTVQTCTATETPETLTLCDITQEPGLDGDRSALNLTTLPNGPTAGAFPNGIGYTVDAGSVGGAGTYLIPGASTQTWTFSEPAMLRFGVNNLNVGAECVTLPVGTVVESIHANHTYNPVTRVLCNGGAAAQTDESIFTLDGATTLAITSNPGGGGLRGLVRLEAGRTTFTEVRTPFLRTICRTCGEAPVITDTTLDGLAPYVPVGTVGVCDAPAAESPCANSTTLLVCDLPTGDPDGTPTITDSAQQFIADTANADFIQRPGGGGALWTGGVINFGPDVSTGPGITQVHRYVAAKLQAVPPSCTDGTVHLSLSVQALNEGPGAGCSGAGRFRLYRISDGAVLASGTPLINTPVGASETLTIEADIPAAELTAGNVAAWLDVETFQTGTCPPPDGKVWQASNFTAAYAYGQDGCQTQFFRTVVTDCETGETLATVDTTPDGAPYVVVGQVGDCGTSDSGSPCPCVSAADIGQAVADAEPCGTASSIGTVCYTPPVAVQTLQDDWTGATSVVGGGSRVWTNPNFAGAGITVTETVTPDTGAALLGAGVRNTATSPASQHTAIDLGAPRTNVTVRMDFFGSVQGERLRNVTPAFAAVSGNGTAVLANTGVDGGPAGDGTIFLTFPGPVQNISWDYAPTGGGLSGQSFISFNTGNASNSAPAAVLRDCETGATTLVDLATGTVLNPATISIVDCPGDEAPTAIDQQDVETLILCDATPTRFLRAIKYDAETGAVLSVVNTALDGTTPFAPVGAVGICSTPVTTDFDFLSTVLCDANGTQFIQRLTFNSATGAVTATTNTTLTGAAFAPVAPIALCSNCCPVVMGSGCTNTGSGFYTAIRATNGTISLIDSVTGAAVLAANIIPCPSDNTVRTLTAQARQLTNATPWTPGDVAGTLTSLTVTGLSGLWDMVDQNGTALTGLPAGLTLTWNADDDNALTGPQSVTPQAGASVVAHWTQR